MIHPLEQSLRAAGLLGEIAPAAESTDVQRAEQARIADARAALSAALAPQWSAFLEEWQSPSLREAAQSQLVRAASAWAAVRAPLWEGPLKEYAPEGLAALLEPWVALLTFQRHPGLPQEPQVLLAGWVEFLVRDPRAAAADFWAALAEAVRHRDSSQDRTIAEQAAEAIAGEALRIARAGMARQPWGWARLRSQWVGVAAALPFLAGEAQAVSDFAQLIAQRTVGWGPRVDCEQAFPALAMALEVRLAREMAIALENHAPRQALERWIFGSISAALPATLPNRLYVPAVRALVRKALHLDAHPQALVPAPILRPGA